MGAGRGAQPLVSVHAVLSPRRPAGLARLLVGRQVQRRRLLGRRPARVGRGVDLQVALCLVLQQLSVVGVGPAALVQALVALAHPGDLQLVGDVVALDLHSLRVGGRFECSYLSPFGGFNLMHLMSEK